MKIIQFDPSSFQLYKFHPYYFTFVYFIPKFHFCRILVLTCEERRHKVIEKRTRERKYLTHHILTIK
jgi:hypothetical protein